MKYMNFYKGLILFIVFIQFYDGSNFLWSGIWPNLHI